MTERLSAEARKSALAQLSGWSETAGREAIGRTFIFKEFNEAFALSQFLPGPNLVNFSVVFGLRFGGPLGATCERTKLGTKPDRSATKASRAIEPSQAVNSRSKMVAWGMGTNLWMDGLEWNRIRWLASLNSY